ncbi:MAG: glycosyltransferase [Bacteroidota bacterium]|nr:glycosyltransferase [Bacteroidota bacterium]
MTQIEISVVIPTYKWPDLLKNCLSSLANQQVEKNRFEIIVVSDGPDAESVKVFNELFLR